jgi:RND family efflux transporter MFP subunit
MKPSEPPSDFGDNLPETPLEPAGKQRIWLLWLFALLLLTGGGFFIWRFLSDIYKAPSSANTPPRVKLATVQRSTTQDSSDFVATLTSRHSVKLQPTTPGQVSQIFVKAGSLVLKGAAIVQVQPRQQPASVNSVTTTAAVATAQSQLANARAQLASLEARRQSNEADVKLNQQQYQKYSVLAEQGAISRESIDQYANKVAIGQAALRDTLGQIQAQQTRIAQAEKSLKQSQATTQQTPTQPQKYKVTAPFRGLVGDIPVKVGDFVNTSSVLTTLTENQPLEVSISVPIERQPQLQNGMLVEIMDSQSHTLGKSKVFSITPSVSNNRQSILVKSLFDNSKDQLRPNQFVQARVIWRQPTAVLIPTTAVYPIAGQNFVYVAQTQQSPQGKSQLVARQKPVKLGNMEGNTYQVVEGLEPGERIVVSGLLNIKDGSLITPEL